MLEHTLQSRVAASAQVRSSVVSDKAPRVRTPREGLQARSDARLADQSRLIQAYARDAYALPGVETVYVDMAAGLTRYAVYRVSGDDTHARLATLSHVETQLFPTVAATFVMRDARQLRRLPVPATAVRISAEGVPVLRDERRLLTSGRLGAAQHE
jgi:hypothetical protein